jgi:hypothetical protein
MYQSPEPRCAKCDGKMEEGFVADFTHGAVLQEQWVAGSPQKSFWVGTKIAGKQCFHVITFRCAVSGHLESYARETVA